MLVDSRNGTVDHTLLYSPEALSPPFTPKNEPNAWLHIKKRNYIHYQTYMICSPVCDEITNRPLQQLNINLALKSANKFRIYSPICFLSKIQRFIHSREPARNICSKERIFNTDIRKNSWLICFSITHINGGLCHIQLHIIGSMLCLILFALLHANLFRLCPIGRLLDRQRRVFVTIRFCKVHLITLLIISDAQKCN